MKTLKAVSKKWDIGSTSPLPVFSAPENKSGLTHDKAKAIADHLNSYKNTEIEPATILKNPKNYVHMCHDDDPEMVVGAAQIQRNDDKTCNLNSLIVGKDHRNKGYGTKVLEQAQEKAGMRNFKTMTTHVDEENHAGKSFLRKNGFDKKEVVHDISTKRDLGRWEKDIPVPEARKKKNKKKTA